jgi:hypothetical protein
MARPRLTPKATLHKSGQAVVRLCGRDHYLGCYGTAEAQAIYDRLIGHWLAHGPHPAAGGRWRPGGVRVDRNQIVLAYLKHCESYYQPGRVAGGAGEVDHVKAAVRPLSRLYGRESAARFGPKKLKSVHQAMLEKRRKPVRGGKVEPGPVLTPRV